MFEEKNQGKALDLGPEQLKGCTLELSDLGKGPGVQLQTWQAVRHPRRWSGRGQQTDQGWRYRVESWYLKPWVPLVKEQK